MKPSPLPVSKVEENGCIALKAADGYEVSIHPLEGKSLEIQRLERANAEMLFKALNTLHLREINEF